jgi:DNA replication and repair protein RecN
MLELLRIQNLALIEDMELEFAEGLNLLSGETGAGKSFILKALNFLLGERMDASLVRAGAEKATAEALFALPEGEVILRRELAASSGRSRIYLNNNLVSQENIKELRPSLVIHASQHGQQRLLQPSFQAMILDSFLMRPELLEERGRPGSKLCAR